ncbi:hypothetical protein HY641_00665 [Candidatus Woesearchaeota archaeon]|nr:hypothetical protein [Candidatus Woesearchaeota archaeon]
MSTVLTTFEWVYGSTQLAAVFLSVVAGVIALSLIHLAARQPLLRAWRYLVWALVLFTLEEIIGALRTFGVVPVLHTEYAWVSHVVPTFVLVFLIAALLNQLNINRGWYLD